MSTGVEPNQTVPTLLKLTSRDTEFLSEIANCCEPINESSVRILVLVGRHVLKVHENLILLSAQRDKSHQAELASLKETYEGRLTLLTSQHASDVVALKGKLKKSHKSIFDIGCKFTPIQKRKLQKAGLTRVYDFTQKTFDEISKLVGRNKTDRIFSYLSLRDFQLGTN